jgi:hypothetical protein
MRKTRQRMNRALQRWADVDNGPQSMRPDAPRVVGRTIVDFATLNLPPDVRVAFAQAFWSHYGPHPSVVAAWQRLQTFGRFLVETQALRSFSDVSHALLVRYIEWLNRQCDTSGTPWSKSTRAQRYTTVRVLLQWLERCRPGLCEALDFPSNPFPWRDRDCQSRQRLGAEQLRAILKACEQDIEQARALRERAVQERAAAGSNNDPTRSLGAVLACIDQRFGGIVPPVRALIRRGNCRLYRSILKCGGTKRVESYLYPNSDALLPYYLAILIHAAGNPEAIASLTDDCLQPIPLLEDREMLVWDKPRAKGVQRRPFRSSAAYEPPTLVREILEWTRVLRTRVNTAHRNHLFLAKNLVSVSVLACEDLLRPLRAFQDRHGFSPFTFASIRPSVLTVIYRATGDLRQAKAVANHAHISTTVRYVEGPEVQAQNQQRLATLQSAFLGRFSSPSSGPSSEPISVKRPAIRPVPEAEIPDGVVVSMFGFGCKDPLAGIAPGTRHGELCTNFLGCLTCPNAIIASDALTVARLLQARDHLRAAAAQLHPARWEVIYAPQLRILEEDILTGFQATELSQAERVRGTLPPLPPLR